MILKGLSNEYNTFTTVMTQKDTPMTFKNFKTALRNFEEAGKTEGNAVMNVKEKKFSGQPTAPLPRGNKTKFDGACLSCGKYGHKSQNCRKALRWCRNGNNKSHDMKFCRKTKTNYTRAK